MIAHNNDQISYMVFVYLGFFNKEGIKPVCFFLFHLNVIIGNNTFN